MMMMIAWNKTGKAVTAASAVLLFALFSSSSLLLVPLESSEHISHGRVVVLVSAQETKTTLSSSTKQRNRNNEKNENTSNHQYNEVEPLISVENDSTTTTTTEMVKRRLEGIVLLLKARPEMCLGMLVRIGVATALVFSLDTFLKTIVTPAIAATGIGIVATPMTFLIGQAVQPIIHSVCFLGFDDPFLEAALEATGMKTKLLSSSSSASASASLSKKAIVWNRIQFWKRNKENNKNDDDEQRKEEQQKEWHRISFWEKFMTRYCIKFLAGWCVGWAGLCTIIPIVGPILTALLSGWVVAWDYVYMSLSGMGYIGFRSQFRTVVLDNFWKYEAYGFWAVLIEEIPILGPSCHVYNIYSAVYFLEQVYGDSNNNSNHDDTESTMLQGLMNNITNVISPDTAGKEL